MRGWLRKRPPPAGAAPFDLRQLAAQVGALEPLLPRLHRLPPDAFARRGGARQGGIERRSPPLALDRGLYCALFWFAAPPGGAPRPLSLRAVGAEDEDSPILFAHGEQTVTPGPARVALAALRFGLDAPAAVVLHARPKGDPGGESGGDSGGDREPPVLLGLDLHRYREESLPPELTPAPASAAPAPPSRLDALIVGGRPPGWLELWLAVPPGCGDAVVRLAGAEGPPAGAAAIEIVLTEAACARFALPDGRSLCPLAFPAPAPLAGRRRVTIAGGAMAADLGVVDLPAPPARGESGGAAEVVALAACGGEVVVLDLWPDYPLRRASPAELPAAAWRWEADGAPGMVVGAGGLRFTAGAMPALRLRRGPAGGRCEIRHRGRVVAIDLRAEIAEDVLVLPALDPAVVAESAGCGLAEGAVVHPALSRLFRRARPAWLAG